MPTTNALLRYEIRSDAITLEKMADRLLDNTKCLVHHATQPSEEGAMLQHLLFARNAIQQAVVLITRGVEDPSTDPPGDEKESLGELRDHPRKL